MCDNETTVIEMQSDLNDSYVSKLVMHNNVEVVCISKFHFQLSQSGLAEMCAKLPRLNIIVLYGTCLALRVKNLALDFPQLTFAICKTVHDHELVSFVF